MPLSYVAHPPDMPDLPVPDPGQRATAAVHLLLQAGVDYLQVGSVRHLLRLRVRVLLCLRLTPTLTFELE